MPANTYQCPVGICEEIENNFPTKGICVAPGKCKGVTSPGLDGKSMNLGGELGGIVGQLLKGVLDKLMQGGGGGGGGQQGGQQGGGQGYYGQQCPTIVPLNCGTGFISIPGGTDYMGCALQNKCVADTTQPDPNDTDGECSWIEQVYGTCGDDGTGGDDDDTPATTTPSTSSLSVSPTSGKAPLTVSINGPTNVLTKISGCVYSIGFFGFSGNGLSVDWGDGTESPSNIESKRGQSCSDEVRRHTYATSGTYTIKVQLWHPGPTDQPIKDWEGSATVTVSVSATSTATSTNALSANPTAGAAPLTVTFTTKTVTGAFYGGVQLDFGNSSSTVVCNPGSSCAGKTITHKYHSAGTFTARLLGIGEGSGSAALLGSVKIEVAQGQIGNPFQQVVLLPNGARGDINVWGSGATIYAGARDAASNSEIAGFYGSDTFGTQQPATLVGRLCEARPWAGNFLSSIIAPSFFDSLCVWRGYRVGPPPQTTQPQVTVTQTPSQSTTAKPSTTQAPAATTTPTVPPKVDVWAVPSQVPLGSRTSVFWNTQGVSSCTVTSPDGSFNQTTPSGGAATVPLTTATTFTISCLAPDGTPVTDYTVVQISI